MSEINKVLVADDSEINRDTFAAILGKDYEVITASDGLETMEILRSEGKEIRALLLDVVMPEMDGFRVMECMKEEGFENIPVIMILGVNTPSIVHRALESGAYDYICRPFDNEVVRRRVANAVDSVMQPAAAVADAIDAADVKKLSFSREKNSDLMVAVLGHILEVRNGESGLHVLHINLITRILLSRLIEKTDKYGISKEDIDIIATASGLHDIGKIYIPEEVLTKPARLTKDEFQVMKTHAALGSELVKSMPFQNEPLLKYAYDISRWHHEKYDGCGYPDGLVGDEIPIWSQVVSLADVYDALTSRRVYKNAYSHEVAMAMIFNGECGDFNPLLLECMKDCEKTIRDGIEEFNRSMQEFDPNVAKKCAH